VAGAAVVWWAASRSRRADAETQYEDPWRLAVDDIIERAESDKICFNVLYTAALYATAPLNLKLDTWTHSSMTDRVTLEKWHRLKGRYNMMNRAHVQNCVLN
jgi:hypothetical protein